MKSGLKEARSLKVSCFAIKLQQNCLDQAFLCSISLNRGCTLPSECSIFEDLETRVVLYRRSARNGPQEDRNGLRRISKIFADWQNILRLAKFS